MEEQRFALHKQFNWNGSVGVATVAKSFPEMEIGNVINVLNQTKTPTQSIVDLGKQLLDSARDGETNRVHELMCRGAPFNNDWLGKTALHWAAENGHYETVEVLLRAGISKDSRTKVDKTPLHFAVSNGKEAIVELLLQHKCDVNAKDMLRMTPLHWAVENDYPNLVPILLNFGADVEAKSTYDETPLLMAYKMGFTDMYEVMQNHKQNVSVTAEEQQEATDSLINEMERETLCSLKQNDLNHDSNSCDRSPSPAINELHSTQDPDKSSLQLLQDDLSVDDTNNFLQSAYACGRQIIVTEFGKQMMMKVQYSNANTNQSIAASSSMQGKNGDTKQKPLGIIMANTTTPKVLTKSNIVKRITSEELTKLCGEGKFIKTVCNPSTINTNGTMRFPKYRIMQKLSDAPMPAIKVIKQGTATISPARKMVISSTEPPQLTNFTTKVKPIVNLNTLKPESNDQKIVQIPKSEYLELIRQLNQLQERVKRLEDHCEKSGCFKRIIADTKY